MWKPPESTHDRVLSSCIVQKPEEVADFKGCGVLQSLVAAHCLQGKKTKTNVDDHPASILNHLKVYLLPALCHWNLVDPALIYRKC